MLNIRWRRPAFPKNTTYVVNYKQAEFLFVVKHVSAVPPPDIEQVPVSIFAAVD